MWKCGKGFCRWPKVELVGADGTWRTTDKLDDWPASWRCRPGRARRLRHRKRRPIVWRRRPGSVAAARRCWRCSGPRLRRVGPAGAAPRRRPRLGGAERRRRAATATSCGWCWRPAEVWCCAASSSAPPPCWLNRWGRNMSRHYSRRRVSRRPIKRRQPLPRVPLLASRLLRLRRRQQSRHFCRWKQLAGRWDFPAWLDERNSSTETTNRCRRRRRRRRRHYHHHHRHGRRRRRWRHHQLHDGENKYEPQTKEAIHRN